MRVLLDQLGQRSEERDFKVEAGRIKAFAAATNDPIPAHRDGELAPPLFAVVPVWEMVSAFGLEIPEEVMLRALHGEQDIFLHRPLRPGEVLRSSAALVGVHSKGSGTTLVTRCESRDSDEDLIVEQYTVTYFRGVSGDESTGEVAPPHKLPEDMKVAEPAATVTQKIDEDQTYRFAEVLGEYHPAHLDENIARSAGLPGIIVHGLCTMAFTSWAAIQELAGAGPTRIKRIAARFASPVLPGEEITTRFWPIARDERSEVFGYETIGSGGAIAIRDGLVELSG